MIARVLTPGHHRGRAADPDPGSCPAARSSQPTNGEGKRPVDGASPGLFRTKPLDKVNREEQDICPLG